MVKTKEKLGYVLYMNPKKTISYYVLSALMQITNRELLSLGIYNIYSKVSSIDEFYNLYFVFDKDDSKYIVAKNSDLFRILVSKCEKWYEANKVYNMNGSIIVKTFDIYCSNMGYEESMRKQIHNIYSGKYSKLNNDYKTYISKKCKKYINQQII